MITTEIKNLCIEASQTYYKYLEDNDKGRSEIDVYSMEAINPVEALSLMLNSAEHV
jgi:hypothetical protein